MRLFDKIIFWFSQGFIKSLYGIISVVIAFTFIYWLYLTEGDNGRMTVTNFETTSTIIFNLIILGLLWFSKSIMNDVITTRSQINELEKLFDENGGYLWSDEQY